MRVLMISWEYPPHLEGGLGRHVAELVPALTQQDIELHVVTPTSEPPQPGQELKQSPDGFLPDLLVPGATVSVEDGVVVHRVFAPRDDTLFDIYVQAIRVNHTLEAYVQQISQQYGPWDLIHIHDWLTGFAGIALQKAIDCPLVATVHATERGRFRGHLDNHVQWSINDAERELVNRADRVIVCSHHMLYELQDFFGVTAAQVDIIPNGVDVSELNRNGRHENLGEFRARYAAPYEKLVFTVSRLVYEKGVHCLIEAAPRILSNCPSTQIVVAGRGPQAEALKQKAEDLGVAQHVNFVGFISDEERNLLFKVADCAVFPSLYEPFGIVALEAMALGCPVVVSEVGGFAEMVIHAETGITTYPGNFESVAWGVSHALTHPDLARKYAVKARRSVTELFNWTRIAGLTKGVYGKVLKVRQNYESI